MKKRMMSILVVVVTLLSVLNFSATAQTAATGQDIVNYAREWIGTPYVWGGTSLSKGIDCSGFICRVYEHFGIDLWGRRTGLRKLVDDGVAIELGTDISQAQPGDIVTCNDGKHVVIYAGDGHVVQASSKHGVCESPATNAWLGNIISIIRIPAINNADAVAAATIQPGLYSLVPMCAPGRRLDVQDGATASGANVQIWQSNDTAAQKWTIEAVGDGYYKLISQKSGKVLDVADAKKTSGTNVQQCIWTDNPAQYWRFTDAGDGYYHVAPRLNTGLRLDVNEKEDANGANVQIWEANDSAAQKWKLIPARSESDTGTSTTTTTKTQYRYHRYTDDRGNVALCPYWGNDRYKTTMHIEYTDWLDAPLTQEEGLRHVYWDRDCANAGCVDASGITFRCRDANGGVWYYEETRNVEVETVTQPNCDSGHTWGGWATVREAGCGKTGQEERTCVVCHEVESRTTTALRHDYQVLRNDDRQVVYACSNCGDSYIEEKEQVSSSKGALPLLPVESYFDDLFWDVERGDWFYPHVVTAYELGLMRGTGEGMFSPTDHMTLAEAVTLAARIHSLYYTGAESFRGYDGGNWYDPYISYARENHIISTNYNYSKPATREEFVHILARALPEEELANVAGMVSFADDNAITYMGDVELLSGAGVINGIVENGQICFKPASTITRAEVAAIVGRMAQPDMRVGW